MNKPVPLAELINQNRCDRCGCSCMGLVPIRAVIRFGRGDVAVSVALCPRCAENLSRLVEAK